MLVTAGFVPVVAPPVEERPPVPAAPGVLAAGSADAAAGSAVAVGSPVAVPGPEPAPAPGDTPCALPAPTAALPAPTAALPAPTTALPALTAALADPALAAGPLPPDTPMSTPTSAPTARSATIPSAHTIDRGAPARPTGAGTAAAGGAAERPGCTIALAAVVDPENGSGCATIGAGVATEIPDTDGSDGKDPRGACGRSGAATATATGGACPCAKCTGGTEAESPPCGAGVGIADSEGAGWYPDTPNDATSDGRYPAANGRSR